MARRKNPVYGSGRKFRYVVDQGIRKPPKSLRGKLTKREQKEFLRTADYMRRVEQLRPFFGDMFTPAAGYNLHIVDKWTPAMKRKITRYYRIIAPRLQGGNYVVKRYRRKDHLEQAIEASLQEKPLPGQTAAIFSVPPKVRKIDVRFQKGKAIVQEKPGMKRIKIDFDREALARDWRAEVARVLALTDAQIFKIQKGGNLSATTVKGKESVFDEIAEIIEAYSHERAREQRWTRRPWVEWLEGIVAYKGTTMREMDRRDEQRAEIVYQRQLERNRERRRREYAVKTAGIKTARGSPARGGPLTRGERLTGRRGRHR